MKVPKRIEELIVKCATHNAIAYKAQEEFESWIESKGIEIDEDVIRDVIIDNVEISNNPQELITYLKNI